MPSRARLDEFIGVVSGDHAGAIERYYTEDASMQENAAPPRAGRDTLVAHERAILERHERTRQRDLGGGGDRVAIHWIFDFTYHSGKRLKSTRSRCRNGAATGFSATILLRTAEAGLMDICSHFGRRRNNWLFVR